MSCDQGFEPPGIQEDVGQDLGVEAFDERSGAGFTLHISLAYLFVFEDNGRAEMRQSLLAVGVIAYLYLPITQE